MPHSIQTIVARLNQPPYEFNLRLVDFDGKKPIELIQILLNVFASIDTTNTGINKLNEGARMYHENEDAVEKVVIPFLSTIQYPFMPKDEDELETLVTAIANGSQRSIYPILLYCLENQDMLKERIYLAPFLTTVQIPLDITMTQRDDALSDLSRRYQARQEEFKHLYAEHKNTKKELNSLEQKSTEDDIEMLQEEKEQLLDKIGEMEDRVRRSGSDFESFQRLLDATSALRREQDEDNHLCQKLSEQKRIEESTTLKLKQAQKRHEFSRAFHCGNSNEVAHDLDSQSILDGIRKEVAEMTMHVRSNLVLERNELQGRLKALEKDRDRPVRTEEELKEVTAKLKGLKEEHDSKLKLLEKERLNSSHKKIAMFRQHATLSSKKLKAKQFEVQSKRDNLEDGKKRLEKLRARVQSFVKTKNDEPVELPNGRILRGSDIEKHLESCKAMLEKEAERKKVLSDLKDQIQGIDEVILGLKAKHESAAQFLEEREEKAGAQEKLRKVEIDAEEVNKVKGETLQEISDIVTEMTETLRGEREKLQPMIQELKLKRNEFKRVQTIHDNKKSRYDKLASKLASERYHLEQECKRLQCQWKESERNYHYLKTANEIAMINLEKIEMEKRWKNGDEKMLPDFKCLHNLYEHKLVQQEHLIKQLRIEQRLIKENEPENIKQKQMFSSLNKLLQLKLRLKKEDEGGSFASYRGGSNDSVSSSIDYDPNTESNAIVMTFE